MYLYLYDLSELSHLIFFSFSCTVFFFFSLELWHFLFSSLLFNPKLSTSFLSLLLTQFILQILLISSFWRRLHWQCLAYSLSITGTQLSFQNHFSISLEIFFTDLLWLYISSISLSHCSLCYEKKKKKQTHNNTHFSSSPPTPSITHLLIFLFTRIVFCVIF